MKVVLIGAGNVAAVLGRRMASAGHTMVQVYSRTAENARELAAELDASFTNSLTAIDKTADIYILALPDGIVTNIAHQFFLGDRLVVHTAGAVAKAVLQNVSERYGVLYPLQSLRKENAGNSIRLPLLVDGNTAAVVEKVEKFATSFSDSVGRANDEQRLKLHLAAVVVNNFTNHLYALAQDYCIKEGVEFAMLQPLIEETALRLRQHQAVDMQTGPAIRNDTGTIQRHLQLLHNYPQLQEVYNLITKLIAVK